MSPEVTADVVEREKGFGCGGGVDADCVIRGIVRSVLDDSNLVATVW